MALDHKELSKMLETAIVAARLAGQRAMEELNYTKVSVKNGKELVTETDARCQQIIIDRIKETYPDHGFIAEEGKEYQIFKQSPRTAEKIWWVIDPIDGTNNFVRKILAFTISIAVVHEGHPVVGVIFDPATDSMFTAVKGQDAQLNARKITTTDDKIEPFTSVGLDSHYDKVPSWALEFMQKTKVRILGSAALQFAYVAKGSLIASVFTDPKLWDMAAGALICQCANALVTDYKGQNIFPLDLDAYDGQSFDMIAANKKVHADIINILNS